MQSVVITVEGMTCGGCVKSVERALVNQAGVTLAKASLTAKNVSVDFDSLVVSRTQLEQAISKAGFTVPG